MIDKLVNAKKLDIEILDQIKKTKEAHTVSAARLLSEAVDDLILKRKKEIEDMKKYSQEVRV